MVKLIKKISGETQIWVGKPKNNEYGVYGRYEISRQLKILCTVIFFLIGYFIGNKSIF